MKELNLKGSPLEIGMLHGKTYSKDIKNILKLYLKLWEIDKTKVSGKIKGFKKSIKKEFPMLALEIEAIAKGASIEADLLYGINSRTELIPRGFMECTSIGIHKKVLGDTMLAQNWDWEPEFRELTKVVSITPNDGPRMKILIEPGMVGKIGFNDSGVGVGLNFLPTKKINTDGIPVHIVLRAILECKSFNEVSKMMKRITHASSANYLVGDSEDNIANIEVRNGKVRIIKDANYVTHTNVFEGESCDRSAKFLSKLKSEGLSLKGIKKSLDYVRLPDKKDPESLTIHRIFMNLEKRKMEILKSGKTYNFSFL